MGIEFDRSRIEPPYTDRERIADLAMGVRAALKPYLDALEDELALAVDRGDHQGVAAIAWDYGPASALIADIEIHFGTAIVAVENQPT